MSTNKLHAWIIFFFLLLSIFLTLGRVGTAFNSFALLNPDLGVYASLAAAQDNPDLFVRDPFLANEKNINSYNMVFVPLIKALNKVFGNYGTACVFLLPFSIFLHLVGYYLLGISIFKNPWTGLLVSLTLSAPTTTPYDFWGLILDPLPRFIYQSLLPFVLTLSIRYGRDIRWWPVILGGIGILNYVHPLSTPAWSVAIVLGLWVSVPELSIRQKVCKMAGTGAILLVILSPFIINYVKSTILQPSDVLSYNQTLSILQSHFSSMSGRNVLSPITVFFTGMMDRNIGLIWYGVWFTGIAGIVVGLNRYRASEEGIHLRQVAAWLVGIIIVGGCVPGVERFVFAQLGRIPPEFEITRLLRYSVPLILLGVWYAFRLTEEAIQKRYFLSPGISRYISTGAGILLLVLWGVASEGHRHEFRHAIRQNISCWQQHMFVCDLPAFSMDFIDMMNILREETPSGARIFSEGQEVAIRYYALRPLVFTYKDGAPLAYTNQKQLVIWRKMYDEMNKLSVIRKSPFRHKRFATGMANIAQMLGADYILLQEPYNPNLFYPSQLNLVYTNDHYSLFIVNSDN